MDERDTVNISEAAEILGCSRVSVYALIKRGELHVWRDPVFTGRPAKISKAEVESLAAKRRASLPPAP
jgi:excisionase family DNA binding protein